MASVKFKGIAELEKEITRTLKKVSESKQMKNEVGEFLQERIKSQARRAKPLNDTGSFPPLKETTVIIREALAETNPTHITFKKNRSNLTFSGQLIDAIKYFVKDSVIFIEVEDSARKPYFNRGKISGKGLAGLRSSIGNLQATSKFLQKTKSSYGLTPKTNKELDADLRRRGFVLYTAKGIDSAPNVIKRINNIVKKYVRRAIKVNFDT